MAFQELTRQSLAGMIAQRIRESILDGRLPEGSKLVERKLAAQFATSATAVREALVELESEGLVLKKPNSATFVTKLTPEGVESVFEMRSVLEAFAVEQAARKANPEDIRRLEEAYIAMVDAARRGDYRAYIIKDLAFHEVIWATSGNEYIRSALWRVNLPYFAFTTIRLSTRDPFDLLQDAQSHISLLEGIRCGNPDAARQMFLVSLDQWLTEAREYVFAKGSGAAGRVPPELVVGQNQRL